MSKGTRRVALQRFVARRLGDKVASNSYDIGYWARYVGVPFSKLFSPQLRRGWKDCNSEVAAEYGP